MASEDESSSAFVSESEEEKAVLVAKGGAAAGEAIEEASEAEATETAEEDTEAEETAEEDNDEDDDDDEKDEEGGAAEAEEEVVMLLCVLSLDDGDVLRKRKIWRRIAVPADFSLLELHVALQVSQVLGALQNAFDWEDTHLHDFTQPRRHAWRRLLDPAAVLADEITDSEAETEGATAKPKPATATAATAAAGIIASATSEVLPPLPDTQYRGFGRTDLSAVAELLQLDLDSLPPGFTRTFKTVAGAKEEAADDLILTPASLDLGGSAEVVFVEHADVAAAGEGKEVALLTGPGEVRRGVGRGDCERVECGVAWSARGKVGERSGEMWGVWIFWERNVEERSLCAPPHTPIPCTPPLLLTLLLPTLLLPTLLLPTLLLPTFLLSHPCFRFPSLPSLSSSPPHQVLDKRAFEVLDERAFEVGAVFSKTDPLLVYQYDFGMSYEVHLIFEGKFPATEGVNYPTCLAGAGASPAEDGNDMDDEGALLPSYDYTDFAVLDVLANFEKTFEDSWPVGPGSEDSIDAPRCYMCRYNRECGRRRECTGKCCGYCLKTPLHLLAGSIPLRFSPTLTRPLLFPALFDCTIPGTTASVGGSIPLRFSPTLTRPLLFPALFNRLPASPLPHPPSPRYNRECGRRRECTGKCCGYCLKTPLHLLAGSIPLRDADAAYEGAAQKLLQEQRKAAESAEA
ncbi:unnamed protein product [Closterium sp. NIES-65]|nr:unnamed protein product [Closterium sp. NIES-65]